MKETVVLLVSFCVGAVPFSYLVAQSVAGADLRTVGSGTVSGTALYRVAGFLPLVVGGVLDVVKGLPGVMLADGAPVLAAFAAGVAVAGHNWSPFIGGAGGRGLSPAMGALLVVAWPGTVLLLGGLALGRLANHTGLSTFLSLLVLPWLLLWSDGSAAMLAGWLSTSAILMKRRVGNSRLPRTPDRPRMVTRRLLFDNDGLTGTP
jgi:glycerol-3-phosphate acyltransferase PlsY